VSKQNQVLLFVFIFVATVWISAMTVDIDETVDLQETRLSEIK